MVRQNVAVRIIFCHPFYCLCWNIRRSIVLIFTVSPLCLLIEITAVIISGLGKHGCRIIAVFRTCIFPFKLMDSFIRNGIAFWIDQTDRRMIQSRHIPLRCCIHQFIGVFSLCLQFFHFTLLCLCCHIKWCCIIAVSFAIHSIIRFTQMVCQRKVIKTILIGNVIGFGRTSLIFL